MSLRYLRSFGLFAALATAASAPFLACSAPSSEDAPETDDAITGVDNALGLGLRYDETSGTVSATLKDSLQPGQHLRIRVRRGTATLTSEHDLRCDDLKEAQPITGAGKRDATTLGKVVYQGPKVDKALIDLLGVYNDPRFQTDQVWAAQRVDEINAGGGPKALVEACILEGSTVKAKLQTGLEYAWDQGNKDANAAKSLTGQVHQLGQGGAGGAAEQPLRSMEEFAAKCVDELGEIPFFKKLANGKYDTFDCRDTLGTGDGHAPTAIDGVEGSLIPMTVDDHPTTKCDGPGPNGTKPNAGYDCISKCDRSEFLSQGCEVGPTVTHAKNAQGTHWILLCRKVSKGEQVGWTKTKTFNDIAMIGSNPTTGKSCFFQNQIGVGTDGQHVPHPADTTKSRTLWDGPEGYCFGSCHSADPFLQSPWINRAKRANGKPIVPMMGQDPDYRMFNTNSPYYVVNMDAQGWTIPKQIKGQDASACTGCHRMAGNTMIGSFANWTTGAGINGGPLTDSYWVKITDTYKQFEQSHWMPLGLSGETAQTWPQTDYAKALTYMNKCNTNPSDPSCEWAEVPRGPGNPPNPNP